MVSYMSDAEYYVGLIKRPVDPHKWFLLMSGYNVNGYGGLKGRAFNELMKLCFSRAELFSFTSMQNPKYQRHPVLEELEDLRIGTIQTDRWFGYYGVEPEICVSIFRAEKAACDVICSYYSDIYLRNKDRVDIALEANDIFPEDYYRLEDLTFYIDGKVFLGTLSHEGEAAMRAPDEEFERQALELGYWSNDPSYNLHAVDFDYVWIEKRPAGGREIGTK